MIAGVALDLLAVVDGPDPPHAGARVDRVKEHRQRERDEHGRRRIASAGRQLRFVLSFLDLAVRRQVVHRRPRHRVRQVAIGEEEHTSQRLSRIRRFGPVPPAAMRRAYSSDPGLLVPPDSSVTVALSSAASRRRRSSGVRADPNRSRASSAIATAQRTAVAVTCLGEPCHCVTRRILAAARTGRWRQPGAPSSAAAAHQPVRRS